MFEWLELSGVEEVYMVVPADKLILDISFNNDSNKSPETMWTTRPFIKITTFFSSEKFKEIISSTS